MEASADPKRAEARRRKRERRAKRDSAEPRRELFDSDEEFDEHLAQIEARHPETIRRLGE